MPNITSADILRVAPGGSSISFDGTTEYARGAAADLGFADAVTVECWFHVVALPGAGVLAYVFDAGEATGSNRIALYLDGADSRLKARASATAGSFTTLQSQPMRAGETYCATLTKSGSAMSLYVNGALHDSTAGAVALATSTSRTVTVAASGTGASFLDGLVRSVAVWNAARSATSVRRTYNGGFAHLSLLTPTTADYAEAGSLRHWWRFARPTGAFGTGGAIVNDHVIVGGVNLEAAASGLAAADFLNSGAGGATLYWGGASCRFVRASSQRLYNGGASVLGFTVPFTVAFWVRGVDVTLGASQQVILKLNRPGTNRSQISIAQRGDVANDPLAVAIFDDASTPVQMLDARWNTLLTNNAWAHVAFTYNGTTTQLLYLNSIQTAASSTPIDVGGTMQDAGREVTLCGQPTGSDFFDGNLGPVAIWNAVLSNDAVRQVYGGRFAFDPRVNLGAYGQSGNLRQYWKPGQDPNALGRAFVPAGGVALSPINLTAQTGATIPA